MSFVAALRVKSCSDKSRRLTLTGSTVSAESNIRPESDNDIYDCYMSLKVITCREEVCKLNMLHFLEEDTLVLPLFHNY